MEEDVFEPAFYLYVLQFLIVFGFLDETFGLTFGALGGSLGPPWGTFGDLWPHF